MEALCARWSALGWTEYLNENADSLTRVVKHPESSPMLNLPEWILCAGWAVLPHPPHVPVHAGRSFPCTMIITTFSGTRAARFRYRTLIPIPTQWRPTCSQCVCKQQRACKRATCLELALDAREPPEDAEPTELAYSLAGI